MRPACLALLIGCSGPEHAPRPPTAVAPTVSCAVQADNFLRYDCAVTLAEPARATVRWGPLDRPEEREATSVEVSTAHDFVLWGLRAGTPHEVRVIADGVPDAAIELVPAEVPTSWDAGVEVTGESTGEAVLVPLQCAPTPTLGVFDTAGRLLAFQAYEGDELVGYNWTRDGTLLALLDNDRVVEHDLLGGKITDLSASAGDFTGEAHHEVHRGPDGLLWVLTRDEVVQRGVTFDVDRVVALDGGVEVAEWHVADHLLAPLDPRHRRDATHGNGVWADEAGDLYLSFRRISTVLKIAGRPGSAGFGEVLWRLTGGPTTAEPSDFELRSTNGATDVLDFGGQHNPNLDADGRLGLFDNRTGIGPTSRALWLELDEAAGVADVVEAYEIGEECPIQGAALPLPDGRRLVTCAETHTAREYAPGAATPSWTLRTTCPSGVARVFPVTLP